MRLSNETDSNTPGRRMHLECFNCGSKVFYNEWDYNKPFTYSYTCVECKSINTVNYPAHQADKKNYRITEVRDFNAVTDTLTVQDDHSVVMDLQFDPDAMCQLVFHLDRALLEMDTSSEVRQLVYTINHEVPPKYDEAGHALAEVITKKVNERLNQLTTLPKEPLNSSKNRLYTSKDWNLDTFNEKAVEQISDELYSSLKKGIRKIMNNMNNWPYFSKDFRAYWDTSLLKQGKLGFFGWMDICVCKDRRLSETDIKLITLP